LLLLGLDRLERLKGIPLKLNAINRFLEENPQWQGKLVFTIIGVTALERGGDYRQTQRDVIARVSNLNEKFTTDGIPTVYFEERSERDIRLPQRLAFFGAADILMSTATRFICEMYNV
jgi:trehalose-6-phosphate synthase